MTPTTPGASSPTELPQTFKIESAADYEAADPPTLASLDAAVSDILDRLDAGDELYRELVDRVAKLEGREVHVTLDGLKASPAFIRQMEEAVRGALPTPDPRRVIGMRNASTEFGPDSLCWGIIVDAGADPHDVQEWRVRWPASDWSPIYAPEPVAEPGGLEVVAWLPPGEPSWHYSSKPDVDFDTMPLVRLSDATALLAAKDAEIERLEALSERLKLEAQIHAGEARTANASLHDCYRAVTQGKGEPANWNGARPVVEELDRLRARIAELLAREVTAADALEHCLKVFHSLADRGYYPSELRPGYDHYLGTPGFGFVSTARAALRPNPEEAKHEGCEWEDYVPAGHVREVTGEVLCEVFTAWSREYADKAADRLNAALRSNPEEATDGE